MLWSENESRTLETEPLTLTAEVFRRWGGGSGGRFISFSGEREGDAVLRSLGTY